VDEYFKKEGKKMKKERKWQILTVVTLLLLFGGMIASLEISGAMAAGGSNQPSSTQTNFAMIGENVEMAVAPAFEVTGWGGITFAFDQETTNIVYPGQTIAEGQLTITNLCPFPQAAYIYAEPIDIDVNSVYPSFEVALSYYGYSPITIDAGQTITVDVTVKIAYGSQISSLFRGVKLVIVATQPPSCSTEGCGGGMG
jgi:hypothetical protein